MGHMGGLTNLRPLAGKMPSQLFKYQWASLASKEGALSKNYLPNLCRIYVTKLILITNFVNMVRKLGMLLHDHFQTVPVASCFSNSTIGISLTHMNANIIFFCFTFASYIPEIILLSKSKEDLNFHIFPYNTLAVLTSLPYMSVSFVLPRSLYLFGDAKFKNIYQRSMVLGFIRKHLKF